MYNKGFTTIIVIPVDVTIIIFLLEIVWRVITMAINITRIVKTPSSLFHHHILPLLQCDLLLFINYYYHCR